jgi:hypothetical protein
MTFLGYIVIVLEKNIFDNNYFFEYNITKLGDLHQIS